MVLTFGWDDKISKAVVTYSSVAAPPQSKKLAGSPPFNLIISMVDIANPAPFTKHPIFPSKATYESPA